MQTLRTVGISDKVKWPAVAILALGVLLLIIGAVTSEDRLIEYGIVLIGASGLVAGVGYKAPAAPVEVVDEPQQQ